MSLKMKEFISESDYVEGVDGTKYWVNPDIPEDLVIDFMDLQNMDTKTKEGLKESNKKTNDLIIKIFEANPKNKDVDFKMFYNSLSYFPKLKIITFVSELITGAVNKKKDSKI